VGRRIEQRGGLRVKWIVKRLVAIMGGAAVMGLCVVSYWSFAAPEVSYPALGDLFQLGPTNWNAHGLNNSVAVTPGNSGRGQGLVSAGTNLTNLFGLGTNLVVPFPGETNGVKNFAERKVLAPGVYLSKPYACIVIVPDASLDAKMVIGPNREVDSKMPMIEPKVEFVPWTNR
jgi:hypothetical protein